jgi:hypothetical protein
MAGVILLVLTVAIRAQLSANSSRAHLSRILMYFRHLYCWPLGGFKLTLARRIDRLKGNGDLGVEASIRSLWVGSLRVSDADGACPRRAESAATPPRLDGERVPGGVQPLGRLRGNREPLPGSSPMACHVGRIHAFTALA